MKDSEEEKMALRCGKSRVRVRKENCGVANLGLELERRSCGSWISKEP